MLILQFIFCLFFDLFLLLKSLFCRCVLEPGDRIVDCPPTFTMYEFDAAVNGAFVVKGRQKLVFPVFSFF